MKQVVKIFYYGPSNPATLMNEFLKENPNHSIYEIVHYGKSMMDFLVVFNVEEEQFRAHE